MTDIILFGIQGSGKGTQGKILADKFDLQIFETGGELRKLSSQDTELAQKVKAIIETGHLVPNEVVMEIVENFLENLPPGKNILFDGIPRKKEQAESLEKLLEKHGRNYMGVYLTLTEKDAMKRLETRRICEKCKTVYPASYAKDKCKKCDSHLITRSDDNPESIRNRFKAYNEETLPVIEEYRKAGKLIEINGAQPIEKVTEELTAKLDTLLV